MFLAAAAFAQLLRECAPNIGTRTMTAIVRVESGGYPYALHDNTLGRSFHPVDAREATAWAQQLVMSHHNIDLGLSQINSANLGKLGMTIGDAFDPCANLHGGATILSFDYRTAVAQFGAGQYALRRAIGAYNSGSIFEGNAYISQILAAAGIAAIADFQVPDVGPLPGAAASFVRSGRAVRLLDRRLLALPAPARASAPVAAPSSGGVTPYNAPLLVTDGIVPLSRSGGTLQRAVASPAPIAVVPQTSPLHSGILIPIAAPVAVASAAPATTPKP